MLATGAATRAREASAMRLLDATPGEAMEVVAIHRSDVMAARLTELGLTPGAQVHVVRRTPFRGPLVVRVRDFDLSMRRDEADGVDVRPFGQAIGAAVSSPGAGRG